MRLEIETYLQPGDHVQLGFRSTLNDPIIGTLLAVNGDLPGDREFVVVKDGSVLDRDGAIGVPERDVVVKVERGDCWVNLAYLMTIDQARVKCERSEKNQARKNIKDFPLFSDQAPVIQPSAEEMVVRFRASAQEDLEKEHGQVMAVNALREECRVMIPPEQYQMLLGRRSIYPASAGYGKIFWTRQISYITEHGHAEPPPTFPPSIASKIGGDFKLDGPAIWTAAPGGPKTVRILFFGRETIMCRVAGEPMKDYDPILIPRPVVWLTLDELQKPLDNQFTNSP